MEGKICKISPLTQFFALIPKIILKSSDFEPKSAKTGLKVVQRHRYSSKYEKNLKFSLKPYPMYFFARIPNFQIKNHESFSFQRYYYLKIDKFSFRAAMKNPTYVLIFLFILVLR